MSKQQMETFYHASSGVQIKSNGNFCGICEITREVYKFVNNTFKKNIEVKFNDYLVKAEEKNFNIKLS